MISHHGPALLAKPWKVKSGGWLKSNEEDDSRDTAMPRYASRTLILEN
jgi:hypothetical protein